MPNLVMQSSVSRSPRASSRTASRPPKCWSACANPKPLPALPHAGQCRGKCDCNLQSDTFIMLKAWATAGGGRNRQSAVTGTTGQIDGQFPIALDTRRIDDSRGGNRDDGA